MVRKANKFPEVGEKVIVTVKNVNPYSVIVALDEYNNKEGMIHISEVARKWIKDIRDFVKVGQKRPALVIKVDRQKNYINLSLKRLEKRDIEEKMNEFKREQKAEKMLALVGKKLGMSLDEAYEKIGFMLQETFEEMFKAFYIALTNSEMLAKKGIPEKYAKAIIDVAKKNMQLKEVKISGILNLSCAKPDGIKRIKKVLMEAEKEGFEVKYISAPSYSISIKTRNIKESEIKLAKMAEKLIKKIEKVGGTGSFSKKRAI